MKRFFGLCGWVLTVASLCSAQALAETPLPSQASAPPQLNQQRGRDPFTPSTLMYESVGAQSANGGGAYGFMPSGDGMHVPSMKLRGLLNQSGSDFIALLEVAGVGTFMVREGDEFNIDPSQPKNAIRIDKITRLSVTVETGMLGSIRVLR